MHPRALRPTVAPAPERRFAPSLLLVLGLLAALPSGSAIARSAANGHSVQDLADFGGCWRTEGASDTSYTEEIWSAPTGNLMLGMTLFVREGRAVQYELTRVEVVGERIVMTPYPNGTASEHGFVLTSLRDGEAIFEAPEHDYPKRILYRSHADGSRSARIDGGAEDTGGQEWRFRRVPCPGTQ